MGSQVGRGQWGDIHGVPQRLIAGGVDEITQHLLVVLDASTLWVAVAQEDELLLLPCPESPHTLLVHLQGWECGEVQGSQPSVGI